MTRAELAQAHAIAALSLVKVFIEAVPHLREAMLKDIEHLEADLSAMPLTDEQIAATVEKVHWVLAAPKEQE